VGQHQAAAGAQHPDGLGHQGVRVGQDLEDVVAQHPVEAGPGQRQGRLEVGLDAQQRRRRGQAGDRPGDRLGGQGQRGRGQVEPGQQPAGDRRGDLGQRAPGAAAQVGDPVAGGGGQQPGQPVVCRLGTTGSIIASTSSGSPAMGGTVAAGAPDRRLVSRRRP
jgi:hypothetical protein